MKTLRHFANVSALTLALTFLSLPLRADDAPAGLVDFGKFTAPSNGGQFVEVHVKSSLIQLAARLTEKQEPEVSSLLRGLHSVRVNVIALDDKNRAEMVERLSKIRSELDTKGWERLVTVQEKDQEVGVFLKQRAEGAIEGIVVTVVEGNKEAVLVNVAGDISPEKLAMLADQLDIEPLKKVGGLTKAKKS